MIVLEVSMAKHRLYSLPYNGARPEWYIDEVMKRKKYIDHVFCELPNESMLSHTRFQFVKNKVEKDKVVNNVSRADYIMNCADFLRLSKGKFRRFCPINAMYYRFKSSDEMVGFIANLLKVVDKYSVDGLIISDYRIARLIHLARPEIEIHTSCNGYQWNIRQMEIWQERCGVKVFNPPREILRTPSKLKEMAEAGFKLKCIVNEGCLMGCPNTFLHQLSISLGCYSGCSGCAQFGVGDIFRGNWILPRWQKYYDKYVYIYKIAGRNIPGDYPFKCLDAFIREDDSLNLLELMISGVIISADKALPLEVKKKITTKIVPDKLLTCECKSCQSCHLCDNILGKIIPQEYHKQFYPSF